MDTAATAPEAPVVVAAEHSDCSYWGADGSAGLTAVTMAATKVTASNCWLAT
jgi:hypothetical protein